jgi:hypothetical protein
MTQPSTGLHRVVIVGSGFGGLFAAKSLARAPDAVEVSLVSRVNHHLFQPLLYQLATGILSEGQIAPATRDVLKNKNVSVELAEVTGFNLEARWAAGVLASPLAKMLADATGAQCDRSGRITFGDKLSEKATRELEKIGVEIHLHSIVTHIDADGVDVKERDGVVRHFSSKTKRKRVSSLTLLPSSSRATPDSLGPFRLGRWFSTCRCLRRRCSGRNSLRCPKVPEVLRPSSTAVWWSRRRRIRAEQLVEVADDRPF